MKSWHPVKRRRVPSAHHQAMRTHWQRLRDSCPELVRPPMFVSSGNVLHRHRPIRRGMNAAPLAIATGPLRIRPYVATNSKLSQPRALSRGPTPAFVKVQLAASAGTFGDRFRRRRAIRRAGSRSIRPGSRHVRALSLRGSARQLPVRLAPLAAIGAPGILPQDPPRSR